ncbi:MAG: hypothetical protein ACXAEU_05475 [Candidatus Hodarchaeales archaeon]|jgi:hypothetical protein
MDKLSDLRPHLEILEKVEQFEKKSETDRFLLILMFVGFITVFAGFIELIFYQFLGTDVTFFLFGATGEPTLSPAAEPFLFLSAWLIHLLPFLAIITFTTGSTGLFNWNKSYRIIGVIIIAIFIITEVVVLILGPTNSNFIPFVWGVAFCLGSMTAGIILPKQADLTGLRAGLLIMGVFSLLLGLLSSLIFTSDLAELALFFFGTTLGMLLTLSAMVLWITKNYLLMRNEG